VSGDWSYRNAANSAFIPLLSGGDETTPHVFTVEQSGATTAAARLNGGNSLGPISVYDTSAETRGLSLFSNQNDVYGSGLSGRFYGGTWINRALTTGERAALERWQSIRTLAA
jgi:hypothetical protein